MSAAPQPPPPANEPSSHSKFTIAFAKHVGNELLARMPDISSQMLTPGFSNTMGFYLTFRWNSATDRPEAMIDIVGNADIVTVPLAFDHYGELGIAGAPPQQQVAPPPQERQHPPQAAAGVPTGAGGAGAGVPIYAPHAAQGPVPVDPNYPQQGPPAEYPSQQPQPQQPAQQIGTYPGVTVPQQQQPLFDPYTGAPLQPQGQPQAPPPPLPPGYDPPVPGSSTQPGARVQLMSGGWRRNSGKLPPRRQLADETR